jgi:DNA-binding IclR family transcriptional regulator
MALNEPILTVLDKVKLIMETLGRLGPLGAADLARATGLPKTTVRRLCGELADWGVVEQPDARYNLGRRLTELSLLAPPGQSLSEQLTPFAADLYASLRRAVTVLTMQGNEVHCLAFVAGTRDESACAGRGTRAPAHATAAGKAMMAFSPREVFASVVSRPLVRLTPYTVCSPRQLAQQIFEARRNGFAVMRQESRLGHASLAVPLHDAAGTLIGSMAVSIPVDTLDTGRFARGLKATAQRVSADLR